MEVECAPLAPEPPAGEQGSQRARRHAAQDTDAAQMSAADGADADMNASTIEAVLEDMLASVQANATTDATTTTAATMAAAPTTAPPAPRRGIRVRNPPDRMAPMQGGDLQDAQCELKARRRDPYTAGQQQIREWGTGPGPRLKVQAAAEGMGRGLFVDDSRDTPWPPQLLPAGTTLYYYGRWYRDHHARQLDYPPGASIDAYVMAETVGILDAGQVDSLSKRINHAEVQMPGDSEDGVYANAKLLGDSGGGEYPEITTQIGRAHV